MKATAQKIEKNLVQLDVEVPAERFSLALEQAYRKLVKKVNIPGFRKGKAPRFIFERYFGKETLYNEALDTLLADAYFQAVMETEIEPIDRPEVELVQAEEGQPLVFKATVQVKPEVELGQYTELEVSKPEVKVTDEDVEKELAQLQQRYAKIQTVEDGTVEKGDVAVIDFEGFIDEEAFAGGKGEEYPLEIGSGTFIPGFEEQLIGARVGETRDVKVTFPQEYHAENLAGKDAVFKVTVKTIRRKELLPLDDEFARDVSEFNSLEELKADIRNRLLETAEKNAETAVRSQVVEKAVANASVDIPEVMIETRLENMVKDMSERLQRQGLTMDDYLMYTGSTLEQVKADLRPEAEKSVRTDLVLEAIARKEEIDATEEEVTAELEKLAKSYKQSVEELRTAFERYGSLDALKNSIAFEKTIKFLVEKAKIA